MTPHTLSLVHLVRQPQIVSAEKPPLLLLLHGIGSNEHDLFSMAPWLDGRFLIVSARAPIAMMPEAHAWFNIEFLQDGAIVPDLDQAIESTQLLASFIDELIEVYAIDPSRVYLMGFSQGAMMSLGVALTRPEKVSRVVAMSGRLPEQVVAAAGDPEELKRLDVFMTHGAFDNVIPVAAGRACRDQLEKLGVAITYREYPMAHEVSIDALRDVAAWLKGRLDQG
jgi:phospholipase/carboxylesterase